MKIRDLPVVATIVVLAAVATMIALGFWQLGRLQEKEAQLAIYSAAQNDNSEIAYPRDDSSLEAALYRRSRFECAQVTDIISVSGSSAKGGSGWAHKAECILPDGSAGEAALGWSRNPAAPEYTGGLVTGVIAPGGRLVADPPLAGLEPLAKPDPADIPNNHLAYAGQWFFFAITALVIFFLAVRRRGKA
jgi:surfeit locus 1 family protein